MILGDYPFPKRENTMYLDTIHPADVPLGQIYGKKDEDLSLKTQDIYKAQPYYHYKNFIQDESRGGYGIGPGGSQQTSFDKEMSKTFQNGGTQEMLMMSGSLKGPCGPGQRAKTCYPPLRRPRDLSLTLFDIEGARPGKTQIFRGSRHVDPLAPEYKLASCTVRGDTPRRFSGRHTNDISDIEYTQSKARIPERNYCRDPNDSSDIEFTCPNYRRRQLNVLPKTASLDVLDINGAKGKRPPFRETNPIDPKYTVSQAPTTSLYHAWNEEQSLAKQPLRPATIGAIPGSKPRKLQWDNFEPQFSLLKADIAGANSQRWIGERPYHVYDDMNKRPPIDFHDPFDIPGAQVNTLKKAMVTQRQTNPLTPNYKLLDGKYDPMPQYQPRTAADYMLTEKARAAKQQAEAAQNSMMNDTVLKPLPLNATSGGGSSASNANVGGDTPIMENMNYNNQNQQTQFQQFAEAQNQGQAQGQQNFNGGKSNSKTKYHNQDQSYADRISHKDTVHAMEMQGQRAVERAQDKENHAGGAGGGPNINGTLTSQNMSMMNGTNTMTSTQKTTTMNSTARTAANMNGRAQTAAQQMDAFVQ